MPSQTPANDATLTEVAGAALGAELGAPPDALLGAEPGVLFAGAALAGEELDGAVLPEALAVVAWEEPDAAPLLVDVLVDATLCSAVAAAETSELPWPPPQALSASTAPITHDTRTTDPFMFRPSRLPIIAIRA